jgi:hypothetical protein
MTVLVDAKRSQRGHEATRNRRDFEKAGVEIIEPFA